MKKRVIILCAALVVPVALMIQLSCNTQSQEASLTGQALIKRGEALTIFGDCATCHSPKIFTEKGPVPDMSRFMSGAPADSKIPAIPSGLISSTAWGGLTTNDMTVWVGPWGASFAANLTPDQVTGIGAWTEEAFIKALRTGKHMGTGRDILPPMPWQGYGTFSDQDLKAMFAYLKSLKPVNNMVPQPIPPDKVLTRM